MLRRIANRARGIASYLRADAIVPHQPVVLEIEATNRCYEACLMCPREAMSRPKGDLSLSLLQDLIEQSKDTVELVNLFHNGEPLMHPRLGELIAYCRSRGLPVLITTTAALLSERKGRELIEAGLSMMVVSLDAVTRETYARVRRHSRFEKVVANVESFMQLKKEMGRGPFVQVQMVAMDFNRREARQFIRRWRGRVDGVRVKRFYNTGNIGPRIGQSVPAPKAAKPLPCIMLWREPVVTWDGTVLPCCVDLNGDKPLGNVKEKSLREIWNGPEVVEMRRLHAEGRYKEIDICRNCTVFQVRPAFALGSLFLDDLSIRKISPLIERLDTVRGLKRASYFE